ncbi:uncharacterized protein UTRI_02282 [Ustilago trichophora]|uniref:Uncharacterized protein n=1 Tax=Ustilago trichophora TaxID=86804 RepID=A0A5C3E6C7_9BASI|nr:uncharacterized protein UTRI_02282 [Ustilago trichophora]
MQTIKHTIAENLGVAPTLSGDPTSLSSLSIVLILNGLAICRERCPRHRRLRGHRLWLHAHVAQGQHLQAVCRVHVGGDHLSSQKRIRPRRTAPTDAASRIVWKQCDLTDWKHVQQVGREITDETDRLDILIANAAKGIMSFALDRNGIDSHMSINHLGHVVLIDALLPLLDKTTKTFQAKVRVVSLSSNLAAQTPKDVEFSGDADFKTDIGPQSLYARTKLANLLFSRYLNRHYTQAGGHTMSSLTPAIRVWSKQGRPKSGFTNLSRSSVTE